MDAIDRRLVETLLRDGRASFAEPGRQVGLSGPSVQERLRRLAEHGTITGFAAVVPPAALGLGVTALTGVLLSDSAWHENVGRRRADGCEIEDCWFIAGEEAFMVKVRAGDVHQLERVLGRLSRVEGACRTSVVLKTLWDGRLAASPPADEAVAPSAPTAGPEGAR